GRPEQALAAIEEAVTIRRRLAADRPAVHLTGLTRSLNNQSDLLRAMGRHAQAQTIDDERDRLTHPDQ
ncbi:hypothetical protein MXD61_00405, partial [Frankia sp. AgPm24]|uniref:hypothetical protein n=1 Tax=Frankia sp. AgPm24 TaxID=631128 RepID=UPI00200F5C16